MARTELPNGVILPAEYSDDWYEDMTSNLTKLDDVIGSDSEKLNADGVYFLRMSSAALTDGGTGNFSDLNSSYKIKTGDLVLDSGRKIYQVVSVDSTNETFTVGNSLFKVTAESDLAPVAESGDYDDLDNKPDLKPVATSGDYDDLDNKPDLKPVATSGDYDDLTDLPTYGITRYCSSAITDNSSVAFSAISSTNKIKVGDFLLDTAGKMYQISSVDTANETVSVTTPLTQLAVDSDVVHKSGNETISGEKTFNDLNIISYGTQYKGSRNAYILPEFSAGYSGLAITTLSFAQTVKFGTFVLDANNKPTLDTSKAYIQMATGENNNVNTCVLESRNSTYSSLGTSANKWSNIYGTEYYYGSNNVEFSTKFVTTDTAQTVSGAKTFSIISLTGYPSIRMYLSDDEWNVLPATVKQSEFRFTDKNAVTVSYFVFQHRNDNTEPFRTCWRQQKMDGTSGYFSVNFNNLGDFYPENNNVITLGKSTNKWKDLYTSKINGVEPSSLSLPSGNVNDVIDISSYISDLSGGINEYTAPVNGWITITCLGCTGIKFSITNFWADGSYRENPDQISCMIPICKNQKVGIYIHGMSATIQAARFIPCQGNV